MQSTFGRQEERASQGPRRRWAPETAQLVAMTGILPGRAFRHHRREYQLSVGKDRHKDRHDGACRATTCGECFWA